MISVTSAASAVRDLPSESSVVRDDSAFLPDLPLPSLTLIVYASPLTTAASAVRDISSESSIIRDDSFGRSTSRSTLCSELYYLYRF